MKIDTALSISSLLISLAALGYTRSDTANATQLAVNSLRTEYSSIQAAISASLDELETRATFLRDRALRLDQRRYTKAQSELVRDAIDQLTILIEQKKKIASRKAPEEQLNAIWSAESEHETHLKLLKLVRDARQVELLASSKGFTAHLDGLTQIIESAEKGFK